MKNIETLKNLKSKLLAATTAVTMATSASAVSASADVITAQDLMDQLINGNKVELNTDQMDAYVEPIKQAVINNGANLLPVDVEETYNNLKNGTSKDRETDAVKLAMSTDYLLDTNMCSTYPQSLQIETIANYSYRELKSMGYDVVPSAYLTNLTGEQNLITLEAILKKARDNREIKEDSYIVIKAIDEGYFDDKCYNIPEVTTTPEPEEEIIEETPKHDDNPPTGKDFNKELSLIALEVAAMGLTFKGKKEEKGKTKVKTR